MVPGNPFDFVTKQDVANKCKEVALTTQSVLDAASILASLCRDHNGINEVHEPASKESERLLKDTIKAAEEVGRSLKLLEEAVLKGDKAGFVNEAKFSATRLAHLIETAKNLGSEREGAKLKQASLKVISASKVALRTPQDVMYKQQLRIAREFIEEATKNCALAIQSKLMSSSSSSDQCKDDPSVLSSSSEGCSSPKPVPAMLTMTSNSLFSPGSPRDIRRLTKEASQNFNQVPWLIDYREELLLLMMPSCIL